jgi:hypothetical protein
MRRTAVLRLLRLANPVVRLVLRSRAHRLLSGSLALLEYRGRRTGRLHVIPVLYATRAGEVVVLAALPAYKQWWRTFRSGAPATLVIRGEPRQVTGLLLEGAKRREVLRAYLGRFPRAARPLGLSRNPADADLDAAPAAVVAFMTAAGVL